MKSVRRHGKRKALYNKFFMRHHRRDEHELEIDLKRQGWRKCGPFFVPYKRKVK